MHKKDGELSSLQAEKTDVEAKMQKLQQELEQKTAEKEAIVSEKGDVDEQNTVIRAGAGAECRKLGVFHELKRSRCRRVFRSWRS